jgi:hypothetical protein
VELPIAMADIGDDTIADSDPQSKTPIAAKSVS